MSNNKTNNNILEKTRQKEVMKTILIVTLLVCVFGIIMHQVQSHEGHSHTHDHDHDHDEEDEDDTGNYCLKYEIFIANICSYFIETTII